MRNVNKPEWQRKYRDSEVKHPQITDRLVTIMNYQSVYEIDGWGTVVCSCAESDIFVVVFCQQLILAFYNISRFTILQWKQALAIDWNAHFLHTWQTAAL